MNRKIVIIIILIILVPILFFGFYAIGSLYIKKLGINLKASKDYELKNVVHYLQNDTNWSSDKIGASSYTMGGAGCLITSVSSAITYLGVEINPKELNQKLSNVDGFDGANLIWYKIKEAIPEVDYSYNRIFTSKTIERDLKQGLLPIVNVKYFKTGITHWVLIVGAKDGEFIIIDPANRNLEPMPLSTHGRVFAYRVLKNN